MSTETTDGQGNAHRTPAGVLPGSSDLELNTCSASDEVYCVPAITYIIFTCVIPMFLFTSKLIRHLNDVTKVTHLTCQTPKPRYFKLYYLPSKEAHS